KRSASFFFSSRRRHTRFSRDWSSDVCSSDLWRFLSYYKMPVMFNAKSKVLKVLRFLKNKLINISFIDEGASIGESSIITASSLRSEERRVGKECRYRTSTKH